MDRLVRLSLGPRLGVADVLVEASGGVADIRKCTKHFHADRFDWLGRRDEHLMSAETVQG